MFDKKRKLPLIWGGVTKTEKTVQDELNSTAMKYGQTDKQTTGHMS